MTSRGTVQRAQDPSLVEPSINWSFFGGIPLNVEIVLKKMVDKIPDFKTLCLAVVKKLGGITVRTFEPIKGGPKGAYIQGGSVYVNKDLDHNNMVNLIVFELTNLMHSKLLKSADSAELIEENEYHGVIIQSGIMNQAKEIGAVSQTPYADLTKKGGRWETFDKYLEDQKSTGHTARYK